MVMLAHGKQPDLTRAHILSKFWEKLRASARAPLPVFRRLEIAQQEQDTSKKTVVEKEKITEGEEAPGFTEHVITVDLLKELGFVEGTLLRLSEEKDVKTNDVWRIESLDEDGVTLVGEIGKTGDKLKVPLERFQSTFVITPELEETVPFTPQSRVCGVVWASVRTS